MLLLTSSIGRNTSGAVLLLLLLLACPALPPAVLLHADLLTWTHESSSTWKPYIAPTPVLKLDSNLISSQDCCVHPAMPRTGLVAGYLLASSACLLSMQAAMERFQSA